MKFELINLASAQEPWAEKVMEMYSNKIKHFIKFEIKNLGSTKSNRDNLEYKIKAETEKILKYLKEDDFVVLFDERGESLSSLNFSKKIERILNSGKKRAVFLIGGSFGVGAAIYQRANFKVSLSPMVLNHLVAQTVVLEQMYRAFTILKNIPYHNQ